MRISDWSSDVCSSDLILGASQQTLKQDMTQLIDLAQASGAKVAVLGFEIPPQLDKDHCAAVLRQVYTRVAQEKNVVLLPSLIAGIWDKPALLLDGGVPQIGRASVGERGGTDE